MMIARFLERILRLTWLDAMYEAGLRARGGRSVFAAMTRQFRLRFEVSPQDLRRIPTKGPVIVVANHPTGLKEGIALTAFLESIRPDVRTLSHSWFSRYPEVAKNMFLVDPQKKGDARANARAVRDATLWVRQGGLLTIYPSGEVARFEPRRGKVTDARWQVGVVRIARQTRATIVPVHVEGRNSFVYYLLSWIHPRLGAMLLVRQLYRQCGTALRLRIGAPVPFEIYQRWGDGAAVLGHVRDRVEELARRRTPQRGGRHQPPAPEITLRRV
jgi:putative hemolysin